MEQIADMQKKQPETLNICVSFVNLTKKRSLFEFIKKRFNKNYDSEENHLIQGELFTWGLKVKNIDNKPTPIGKIIHYGIKNLDSNYYVSTSHEGFKTIRPLNPDEEVTILLDNDISYVEGALWVYAIIESQDNSIVFRNHQKKHYHDKYVYCWSGEESYNWIDGIYIQKKTELLQKKTNDYILLLTVISVWESLFGIKNTVINLLSYVSKLFNLLGGVTSFFAKMLG